MKAVGLVVRPSFPEGVESTRPLVSFLDGKGVSVHLPPHLAKALNRPDLSSPIAGMQVDAVVTIGGDGTILYAARHLPPEIPILPINFLSFGYLTECDLEDAHQILEAMLAGDLRVQESIRLAASAPKMKLPDAANEVSIFPSDLSRPISIQVRIDEHSPFQFRADGFLITTPLGSTGHALSLGGPVLDTNLDAMLLIAAAPLRRSFLPLIINSSQPVFLEAEKPVQLYADGESCAEIPPKTRITVEKSAKPLRILRHPARLHMRLQEKLLRC